MHKKIKINRLVNVFKASSTDGQKYNFFFSDHWKGYLKKNSNLFINKNEIKSFRDKLSLGMDDSRTNSLDIETISNFFIKLGKNFVLRNLEKKNIGNSPNSRIFLGHLFDFNRLFHIYFYSLIKKLIPNRLFLICEIGGGFGSLAQIIIKNHKSVKYFLLDLPESNLISTFYLSEHFPLKRFFLYDNYLIKSRIDHSDLLNYDIFILPPWVQFEKTLYINLFINTRSMMEMNKKSIEYYFNFIHSHSFSTSFFLNINRYEKTTVGERIRICDYPYDSYWRSVLSHPSFLQPHIHVLLARRTKKNNRKNFKKSIKKIRLLGSSYYIPEITFYFGRFNSLLRNIAKSILRKASI